LFGHSHGELPGPFFANHTKVDIARGTIHGVPAVMPGRWGDHLGAIDLTLRRTGSGADARWQVADSRAMLRPITDRATRKPRVADDPSVQIVSQAQLAYARRALAGTEFESLQLLSAAAPFKAGGRMGWRYYTDMPAGPLSIRHLVDLCTYPNTVKAVWVSDATVREWLDHSAGQFRRIDPAGPATQPLIDARFRTYNFDTIDGVSDQIDVTQPARSDPDGKLIAPGGGGFPVLDGRNIVGDAPDENREALVQYMRASETPNPAADGNWRIQPVPGVRLLFDSGAGGIAHLARHPQIRLVQDNGDGSATFELVG
jgi:2',3'-cyclic-nucleotide 2'-phosphodiesterase/3'-nucleotidase